MNKKQQLLVLGIISAIISTGFVVALAQPFSGSLIVMFGNSKAEKRAVSILSEGLPNSVIVGYDTIQCDFLEMKCIGSVILVGHGNEDGIYKGNTLVRTNTLINELSMTPAPKIYLVACNSRAVANQDVSRRTFGFPYAIDAELAALEIVIRVQASHNMASSAMQTYCTLLDVLNSKISNEQSIMPLMPIDDGGGGPPSPPQPYLSTAEMFNCALIFAWGCVFALVGVGVSAATTKLGNAIGARLGSLSASSGILGQLYNFFTAIGPAGIGSLLALVNATFGGFLSFASSWLSTSVEIVSSWIASMDIGEWAFFLTLTALEVFVVILTCGAEALIRLEAGIAIAATNSAVIAISDYYDADGVPCQSLMEAVSQFY
jgi:hypothetical protein